MKEVTEVQVLIHSNLYGPSVFALVHNNAEPEVAFFKEVQIVKNPYGPSKAELIPQNS